MTPAAPRRLASSFRKHVDDLAAHRIDRDSLPEIQRDRVEEYLAEIETRGANLLSINQEAGASAGRTGLAQLNLHQIIADRGKLECRSRHPYWIRRGWVEEWFTPYRR